MKQLPVSKFRSTLLTIAFCILAASIGYRMGERQSTISVTPENKIVVNRQSPQSETVDFSLFWVVWQKLYQSFIDRAALDPQKMVYGAISGMVNALDDPYTMFLPPKDNKDFKEDLGGQFEGIGAQLGLKDGNIIVVSPLKDNPAIKAGIRAGDYILKVNDEETTGWTVQQAVAKIRGPKGTSVTLTILHENEGKPVDISVVRNTITVATVETWVKSPVQITEISGVKGYEKLKNNSNKVAYIQLSRFGDHSNDEWDRGVETIVAALAKDTSIKGLIFDLRNNPGGYLESAVYIGSEFVKKGIIVSQVNTDGSRQDYTVTRQGKLTNAKVIVLVNKGSASAAEIVAGAIRDHKRGTLVGDTTFGKGSVQTPEDLEGGAGLHITTGKWLLPSGDSIHKKGVEPDVKLSLETNEATMDAQLEKAVELLLK